MFDKRSLKKKTSATVSTKKLNSETQRRFPQTKQDHKNWLVKFDVLTLRIVFFWKEHHLQCFCWMLHGPELKPPQKLTTNLVYCTLPETNIAMENPPFWWYLPGKMGIFMGYVSFREGSPFVEMSLVLGPQAPSGTIAVPPTSHLQLSLPKRD